MKLKKVIAVSVMATLAVSSMFAWSWGKKKDKKSKASEAKLITVGYAQVGAESDWRLANTQSFKDTFVEANGYKLIFDDAQQKQENQIKAIRNFIQQDVDYIVVAPVVETGWETVLQEAKKAGIPVILSDRMMKVSDDSLFTAWVGGNFLKEGQDGCKWLEAYLKSVGRENETINIVDLQGTIGASAQIGRTQGLEEAVKAHKNWNIVAQQTGEFTQSKGQEVMESILKSVSKIDVVYAENDNMAWGAIDAIKAAGKKPGKDIIIICFDAVHESFNRMIDGEINCAVECNPLHGPRTAEIIQKLEKKQKVEKIQYVTELVFDKNGVGDALKAADELPNRKY
ncbi:MAG: ABC transporter substrate-binding protein [Treponema sp.]|nr:ABC transporter substrate-binding protein [Treponema sp.]